MASLLSLRLQGSRELGIKDGETEEFAQKAVDIAPCYYITGNHEAWLGEEYDAGVYTEGTTTMVVSRGVGNSINPVRVNNRSEIVVVELQK